MKRLLQNKTLAYTVGLLLTVGAVGLLYGCGEQPTGPTMGNDDPAVTHNLGKGQDTKAANNGNVSQAGLLRQLLTVVEETTTEVVGELGGVVRVVVSSGETELTVPSEAVDGTVAIEMSVTQTESRGRFYTEYEFGPHGLEFNKATTLSLALPYANGTVVSLRWFNPDSDQWELQERSLVRNGKVEFSVYHFSKYGIS
jgi:hypothetical protein